MMTLMISTVALLFAGSAMAMTWDTDGDGKESADEYKAAQEREAVFHARDKDEDGMLSSDEFAMFKWTTFDRDDGGMWDESE